MSHKLPTDGSFTVLLSWIIVTIMIGISLWKLDQLMEALAKFLFN